jgi:hypothetical protein
VQGTRIRRGLSLGDDIEARQPAEQQQVSSARLPKTILTRSAETDHSEARAAPSRPDVGRLRTPARTMKADWANWPSANESTWALRNARNSLMAKTSR